LIGWIEHPRRTLLGIGVIEFILIIPLLFAIIGVIFDRWANERWFIDISPVTFLSFCGIVVITLVLLRFTAVEVARTEAKLQFYCERNEFGKARRLIEKKLSHSPKQFRPMFMGMKTYLLIKEKRYDEALSGAKKLTEEFPGYPFGWYLLAYLQSRMGEDLEAAGKSLSMAMSLFGREAENHRRSGKMVLEHVLQDVKEDEYLKNLIRQEEMKKYGKAN